MNRTCGACHEVKELDAFYKNKLGRDGYGYFCKPCAKEKTRAYALKNPEKVRAYKKKYCDENRKKVYAANAKWKAKNPEKVKAYDTKSRSKYPEKQKARRSVRTAVRAGKLVKIGRTLTKRSAN